MVGLLQFVKFLKFIKFIKKESKPQRGVILIGHQERQPRRGFFLLNSHVIYDVGGKEKETYYSVPGA